MRYVALVVLLLIVYIVTSFYVLSSYRLYGTSMKAVLFTYLNYPGVPSEDYETDEIETGLSHIHVECSTWGSMATYLLETVQNATILSSNVIKETSNTMHLFNEFVFEIEVVLDEFREKIDLSLPNIREYSSDVADVMQGDCEYLGEAYKDIQQRARYTGVSIAGDSEKAVRKINNKMATMFKGLFEKVVRNATASNIRECTCELLLNVNIYQDYHLTGVKKCTDNYAIRSIQFLNATAYDLLNVSEGQMDTLSLSYQKMIPTDLELYLPVESTKYKNQIRKSKQDALDNIDEVYNEFVQCKNVAANLAESEAIQLFKYLLACFQFIDMFPDEDLYGNQ